MTEYFVCVQNNADLTAQVAHQLLQGPTVLLSTPITEVP